MSLSDDASLFKRITFSSFPYHPNRLRGLEPRRPLFAGCPCDGCVINPICQAQQQALQKSRTPYKVVELDFLLHHNPQRICHHPTSYPPPHPSNHPVRSRIGRKHYTFHPNCVYLYRDLSGPRCCNSCTDHHGALPPILISLVLASKSSMFCVSRHAMHAGH